MESTDVIISDVSFESSTEEPSDPVQSFDFGSGMLTNILLLVAIFFLIMIFTRSRR